eukprot:2761078-Prymnesium_polylepis.1
MRCSDYLGSFSARCAATRSTQNRDARHETVAGAASLIRLSCPSGRERGRPSQTHPTYPTPHGGARSASALLAAPAA